LLKEAQIRVVSGLSDRAIPLHLVQRVEVVEHSQGIMDGTLIGGGAGLVSGGLLGLWIVTHNTTSSNFTVVEVTTATLGLIGFFLGALIGGGVGHRDILTF
jgi:hypothetical protein